MTTNKRRFHANPGSAGNRRRASGPIHRLPSTVPLALPGHPVLNRRRFLKVATAGLLSLTASAALLPARRKSFAAQYRVGIGQTTDPYEATQRAITASSDWSPAVISGRKVVIKPNLVLGLGADTGITTDPEVVRAIVDMALEAGAKEVLIVEQGPDGANFTAAGYGFLATYDPDGRVSLVDLDDQPFRLAEVPDGLAYGQLYMPDLLFDPESYLISVGKMKCHMETLVTLSVKNLFGLPPIDAYLSPPQQGRFAMHRRGVNQSIVDLNLARPIDFAVVDGIWSMEGNGPWGGNPVRLNMVVAGRNALAVDRVCLTAMQIPQAWVQHLAYAADKGLGPADIGPIEFRGDVFTPQVFLQPDIPPVIDFPKSDPPVFNPGHNQQTTVAYWVNRLCLTQVDIVRTDEKSPEVTLVRLLRDWSTRPAGIDTLTWDGRDEAGQLVPPGTYKIRVQATHGEWANNAFATGEITVINDKPGQSQYMPLILG